LQEVLSVRSVSKAYPGATALQDVSLSIRPGEIRGLCGENGAGKSTLVNILMGIVQPDSGSIAINGQTRSLRGPQEAQGLGLGLVAQELSLAPHLSILDNIWLGSAEVPFVHRRATFRVRAQQALATLGLADWDLDRPVSSLAIGQRQLIEIARLLARDARVLILDEPTATLSDADIERILGILKGLPAHGRSIIYITHRLGEVFELCDSVTVLRNGRHVATEPVSAVTREHLVELMLGRSFEDMYPEAAARPDQGGRVVVDGLDVPGTLYNFSMVAPRGRIVCIAGQIGSGANMVTRALAGLVPSATGKVTVDGRPLGLGSVPHCVARNVLFVSAPDGSQPRGASRCRPSPAQIAIDHAQRRQPAEAAVRPGTCERRGRRTADERADPRHRCRRACRDISDHARAVPPRICSDHDFVRSRGGGRHRRYRDHALPRPRGRTLRG
jgi:ABC-type sugar transport system ATPase subunit